MASKVTTAKSLATESTSTSSTSEKRSSLQIYRKSRSQKHLPTRETRSRNSVCWVSYRQGRLGSDLSNFPSNSSSLPSPTDSTYFTASTYSTNFTVSTHFTSSTAQDSRHSSTSNPRPDRQHRARQGSSTAHFYNSRGSSTIHRVPLCMNFSLRLASLTASNQNVWRVYRQPGQSHAEKKGLDLNTQPVHRPGEFSTTKK